MTPSQIRMAKGVNSMDSSGVFPCHKSSLSNSRVYQTCIGVSEFQRALTISLLPLAREKTKVVVV